MRTRALFCTSLLFLLALVPVAKADSINITGTLTISDTSITFNGAVASGNPQPGVFVIIPSGTPGIFKNLSIASQPVGSSFSSYQFGTIGGFTFNLTSILPGAYSSAACNLPAAPLQTCTPNVSNSYQSALNLQNVGTGSTVRFSFLGTVTGPGIAGSSPFDGTITGVFANSSYQQFLSDLKTNGSVSYAFSSGIELTPAAPHVPEPATLVMFGTGLCGLAGVIRRKRAR